MANEELKSISITEAQALVAAEIARSYLETQNLEGFNVSETLERTKGIEPDVLVTVAGGDATQNSIESSGSRVNKENGGVGEVLNKEKSKEERVKEIVSNLKNIYGLDEDKALELAKSGNGQMPSSEQIDEARKRQQREEEEARRMAAAMIAPVAGGAIAAIGSFLSQFEPEEASLKNSGLLSLQSLPKNKANTQGVVLG